MIIDSHLHLNKTDSEADFGQAFSRLVGDLNINKVDKAVIIADDIKNGNCADTWHALSVVGNNDQFFVIGSPNIQDISQSDWDFFEDNLANKRLVGLKLFPGHEPFYPTDPRCNKVYELAEKYSVPVMFHTGINTGDTECSKYNDPKYILEIANKYPNVNFVIAHYFWPKLDYCFEMTSRVSNIYYDTSAMADQEVVDMSGGIDKIKEIIIKTLAIKPYGVMFGSDHDMCVQSDHIKLIEKLGVPEKIKNDILSQNFLDCFKL